MRLQTDGHWFIDDKGNRILLRGVNLGGSSKVPIGGETHCPANYGRDVSFIGRPFPLSEADEHFSRLKHWGFNLLRFLTTWEAIEHSGPNEFDKGYLNYLEKIIEIAGEYGFYVFIDPHQDVWSRATGGDGAPHWIFDKLDMDLSRFDKSEAALTMQGNFPENYPPMSWTSNYNRFVTATMFTLFFGGRKFAPNLIIEDENVQDYLQQHYFSSLTQVALQLSSMEHVIGFGTMNEPSNGYIGYRNITDLPELPIPGKFFSPFEAMQAAYGRTLEIKVYGIKWSGIGEIKRDILNPEGISIWKDPDSAIWINENVWKPNEKGDEVLHPNHFAILGQEFFKDYLRPFAIKFTGLIREIIPDSLIFLEGTPSANTIHWENSDAKGVVNASHWYDGLTLFTKKFQLWVNVDIETKRPVFFPWGIKRMFRRQLNKRIENSQQIHGGIPTLIGEFGVPFDLDNKKSYHSGDFSKQAKALNVYYEIMEDLLLHTAIWNYTSDNTNEWGDNWNLEDLSIFSRDQQLEKNDINSGGRAVSAFCRPYPIKTQGYPIKLKFHKKTFVFHYIAEGTGISEIFIPSLHFPNYAVQIENGNILEKKDSILKIKGSSGIVKLKITKI